MMLTTLLGYGVLFVVDGIPYMLMMDWSAVSIYRFSMHSGTIWCLFSCSCLVYSDT